MSLNYRTSNIKDYAVNFPASEGVHPTTAAITWLCMLAGVSEITEKNKDKVARRFLAFQAVSGSVLSNSYLVTLDDVRKHVGFLTNVPPLTDAKWERTLGQLVMDRVKLTP